METHKFEFKKLELPKKVLIQDNRSNLTTLTNNNNTKSNSFVYSYLFIAIISSILSFSIGYFIKTYNTIPSITRSKTKIVKIPNINKIASIKPVYFNYYDSFLFLNQVKGEKKVISKGYDDYIKKNKLIVKVNGFYYNLFCEDLINNYAVGDTIP